MPVPGGTIRKALKACCPHFKKLYLSRFLENSEMIFFFNAELLDVKYAEIE